MARTPWGAWCRVDRVDLLWLLGLTLIAGALRFGSPIFLDVFTHPGSGPPVTAWGIGHSYYDPKLPSEGGSNANPIAPGSAFVFDEVYFANDANDDLRGRDYLDPEPPLAKLIIALGIQRFGFNAFGWRVMTGLFGTVLIPLMYLLARQLFPLRFPAVAAGLLTTFDGMTFVESRVGVIDIFPIVFVIAAYLAFHLHLRADTPLRQRAAILASGIILGLGLGSKWTALAAYGTIALILAARFVMRRVRYDPVTGAVVGASLTVVPGLVYLLSFTHYLTVAHSLTGFATPALALSPFHLDLGRAWDELASFHRWTFNYHYNLRAPHPYYSPWFSWPVLYRPVAYYYQGQDLGTDQVTRANLVAEIFNLGNPAIWWASIVALIVTAGFGLTRRSYPAGFILLAFAAAWLPFARVPRGLFLYHMLGGLPFMILAIALVLTTVRVSLPFAERFEAIGAVFPAYAYLAVVIAVFIFFYPLWTGLPLTYAAWQRHIWLPSWL